MDAVLARKERASMMLRHEQTEGSTDSSQKMALIVRSYKNATMVPDKSNATASQSGRIPPVQ